MKIQTLLAGAATAALTAGASAAFVVVDDLGGPVQMNAIDLPGVLAGAPGTFTDTDLTSVHSILNDAGIATDGFVTFLLAETDAGLSFFTLVDEPVTPLTGSLDSEILMSTTGPSSLTAWFNADGDDQTNLIGFDGSQTAQAVWTWDGADEGRGFAWGGLVNGDSVSMFFRDRGAPAIGDGDQPAFQFVSMVDGELEQVATADFTVNNQYSFSFFTIPGPGVPALLCVAGLVGGGRRRRRA